MIFITGADLRFANEVKDWINCIEKWGYNYAVYDLGKLPIKSIKGFEVTDANFVMHGFYNCLGGHWFSTGLWKPRVILDALNRFNDDIIYLDADARLQQPLTFDFNKFDIGIVKREENLNLDKTAVKEFLRGDYNAGVIFLKNCLEIKYFVSEWAIETPKNQNDQATLSILLRKSALRKLILPEQYNMHKLKKNTIVLHQTGGEKHGRVYRATH